MKDKDKITLQFRDKQISINGNEDDYYRILGFLTERNFIVSDPKTEPLFNDDNVVIPSSNRVEDFIKRKPDYSHSIAAVTYFFIGDVTKLSETQAKRWDTAIRMKLNRVKAKIADEENGEWESKNEGRSKVFWFKRREL